MNWLDRESRSLGAVMQRRGDPMFGPVIVRGQSSRVWDAEGNRYFDLTCGYSAANFGHAFEPLIQAAQRQLVTLTHLTGMAHPGRAELAELLIEHCGRAGDRVIFNTSGARAVETALKIALQHRPGRIVSIGSAYHGRSLATSALSDTAQVNFDALPSLVRRPLDEFAYCAACSHGLTFPTCQLRCADSLVAWIEREHEQLSAIIVEPALGARGYIAPPAAYWHQLRDVTKRYGILMIADEIQMGLGRAGDWLLSRRQGWQADLIVLGKSLGGGIVPISAVIGAAGLLDQLPSGSESETFAGSPLATAIGSEVMRQLASGPWLARADSLGLHLAAALVDRPARVETLGASATLEFIEPQLNTVHSDSQLAKAAHAAREWAVRMRQARLLVHYSGPYSTRIVLLPALTITDSELAETCGILRTLSLRR